MGAGTAYKVPGRADSRSKFSEIRQTPLRRDIIDRTTDPRARLPLGPDACSPANSLGKRGTSASSATHWEASADFARGARLLLAFLRCCWRSYATSILRSTADCCSNWASRSNSRPDRRRKHKRPVPPASSPGARAFCRTWCASVRPGRGRAVVEVRKAGCGCRCGRVAHRSDRDRAGLGGGRPDHAPCVLPLAAARVVRVRVP